MSTKAFRRKWKKTIKLGICGYLSKDSDLPCKLRLLTY